MNTETLIKINFRSVHTQESWENGYYFQCHQQDKLCIGTEHYQGLAYFWGSNGLKHYLRDATPSQRRKVHKKWLKAGLSLDGDTPMHEVIVLEVIGKK